MRIVIQRVKHAKVTIDGQVHSSIGQGYLILLGVCDEDSSEDVDWLVRKVIGLRVFDDENHVMNRDIMDVQGEILVISQFTLFASYKKGNRPSWFRAGSHEHSIPLYEEFCDKLSNLLGKPVGTGEFGADMKVELLNDGPVTICMDTKNKE
jgi:D-tyrosyl-tRNA(Tyr) deacylase